MWLGGVSVFGSFAARYSSEAALCGNTRNICHKQTPSRYDWKTVESEVKHHSLTHSILWTAVMAQLLELPPCKWEIAKKVSNHKTLTSQNCYASSLGTHALEEKASTTVDCLSSYYEMWTWFTGFTVHVMSLFWLYDMGQWFLQV